MVRICATLVPRAAGRAASMRARTAGAGSAVDAKLIRSVAAAIAANRALLAAGLCIRITNLVCVRTADTVAYVVTGCAAGSVAEALIGCGAAIPRAAPLE